MVAAINDTNGGLYMALMGRYGRPQDAAAYSVMSIESGPFLTMVTLGVAGLSAFPWPVLLGSVLPLIVGIVIGNLDHEMRDFLRPAIPVMIPFFAFGLGSGLDLHHVVEAGFLGVALGMTVVAVTAPGAVGSWTRATGGTGVAGVAAASTAGNAAAVPALVAAANPVYAEAAKSGTVLVVASIIVTGILVPLVTTWWAGRVGLREGGGSPRGRWKPASDARQES